MTRVEAMLGELHPDDIEDLLYRHHVGHLACVVDGDPYIVPITFLYNGHSLYGHTVEGRKVQAMRAHPVISFGVQEHDEPDSWRSVVVEGMFEEVNGEADRSAVREMLERVAPQVRSGDLGVFFRIHLTHRSGRWLRTGHGMEDHGE